MCEAKVPSSILPVSRSAPSFQAHPWHGVEPGENVPTSLNVYVELVPTDAAKYELDKRSGHLRLDRPQRYSSLCPTLYGFLPKSYCAERVAERCMERLGRTGIRGDGDPLDVCVLTEKAIPHGNFLAHVRPLGGLRMVDGDEADDKIIAVLENDLAYGALEELTDCPVPLVDRIRHYFLSYKQLPGSSPRRVEIGEVYGRDEAHEVIRRALEDYQRHFVTSG